MVGYGGVPAMPGGGRCTPQPYGGLRLEVRWQLGRLGESGSVNADADAADGNDRSTVREPIPSPDVPAEDVMKSPSSQPTETPASTHTLRRLR